ncbi:hypothetical protein HDZ31DRAFT_83014 [Schizophyllum fasciatum]
MYQTPDPRTMSQPPPPPVQPPEPECAKVEPMPLYEPMDTSPAASTSCQSPPAPMTPPSLPQSAPMTPPVPSRAPSPPVYPACMMRKQESPVPLPPVPQCEAPPADDLFASPPQSTYPVPPVPGCWPPMPLTPFDQAYLMASAFPYLPWWNAMLALASCPPVPPPVPPAFESQSAPSAAAWDAPAPAGYGVQQPSFEQLMASMANCSSAWGVPPVPPAVQPELPLGGESPGVTPLPSDDFSQLFDGMLGEHTPCSMDPMSWTPPLEPSASDASLSPLCSTSSTLSFDASCPSLSTPGSSPGFGPFGSDDIFGMPTSDTSCLPDMNIDFSAWDLSLPCDGEQQQVDAQGMFQPFVPREDSWLTPEFA